MPARRSTRRRGPKKNYLWTRASSSVTLPATTAGKLIDFTADLREATGVNTGKLNAHWTIERILGRLDLTVPASTAAGRSYNAFLAIDTIDTDAEAAGAFPEPFTDNRKYPWIDGIRVFAPHTVPASYAIVGDGGMVTLDMKSKRAGGWNNELLMIGNHDDGLGANPVMYFSYSALWSNVS